MGEAKEQVVKELMDQHCQCQAREHRLMEELTRLRQHLLQVEEQYTEELLAAEEREGQLSEEVERLRAEVTSLANQMADNRFQERLRAVVTEREMARNECSQLEDKVQQYSTSVANLQVVIEQIQKGLTSFSF